MAVADGLPRASLDRALTAPRAIVAAGRSLTRDEIAAELGVRPGTGSANTRTIAAKKFGLIRADAAGGYAVTETGRRLVDDPGNMDLRRSAIRGVDLFGRLWEHFETDPSNVSRADLARALRGAGVTRERADEAAGVLERSLSHRPPRVRRADGPAAVAIEASAASTCAADPSVRRLVVTGPSAAASAGLLDHPLVRDILGRVPARTGDWDAERRDAWLDLFSSAVRFVVPGGSD